MSGHYGKTVLHELTVENGMMQFKERKTILMKHQITWCWISLKMYKKLNFKLSFPICDYWHFFVEFEIDCVEQINDWPHSLCNPSNPNDIYKKLEKKLFVFLSIFVFKGQCFN